MISWIWLMITILVGFILGIFFHAWLEYYCLPGREIKKLLEEHKKKEVKDDNTYE